jgi:hypothetical protein
LEPRSQPSAWNCSSPDIEMAFVGWAGCFTDDDAGSHWLSSFVFFPLTRNEGGIER